MTRPNIVRADTIDLQDQDSPAAAEHHRPSLQGGLAPHQRAEVHHVIEERHSEEHALADAWKMSDNLTDEPETIDEAQQYHNTVDQPVANGIHHENGEGGGGGGEGDADDDMMDRISSSPSIDDGVYSPHSSPLPSTPCRKVWWPDRKSSLSPSRQDSPTPTRKTFNQSASSSSGSSPFMRTPQHLPLHVRRTGRGASPLLHEVDWSSSPFEGSPTHLPLRSSEDSDKENFSFVTSEHHQQLGRYKPLPELPKLESGPDSASREDSHEDEGFFDGVSPGLELNMDYQYLKIDQPTERESGSNGEQGEDIATIPSKRDLTKMTPIESPFRKHVWTQSLPDLSESKLEESPSLTSISSMDLQDVLLPVDDPLLDTPPSPTDSSGSWESLSTSEDGSMEQKQIDDDIDALFDGLDDRFIDSGWGGECLRETEDIDFEFVYALHTFVATVEGQANAAKGDTMVLLDDSNSYWWLVRVVKDSSIGYLPAEHIETPTERLARLNKHRNIDLSATMLSDNSEKTRNPLKRLRKRNVKTVQFAAPTYVEASDYDYDDDEEEETVEAYADATRAEDIQQSAEISDELQNGDFVDEEAPRASTPQRGSFDREQAATLAAASDDPQLSPKLVDRTEAAPLKSRKSRNTDSFLKDDNAETRKITITPGLLREDQMAKASSSSENIRNDDLDSIVKSISPPEPLSKKDSKKEKEKKKDGFIKGLFKSKKKDKKAKEDAELSDEKPSTEYARDSPIITPLTSGRNSPGQESPNITSAVDSRAIDIQPRPQSQDQVEQQTYGQPRSAAAELQGSEAAHEMGQSEPQMLNTSLAQQEKPSGPLSPITNLLKRDDSKTAKPAKAKRAKERVELDDFDSPDEDDEHSPFEEQEERAASTGGSDERLSDSPVEISQNTFMHGTESVHIPTPGPYDQPGVGEDDDDEPESMTSSPSIIEHPSEPPEATNSTAQQDDDDSTPKGPRSPDTAGNNADKATTHTSRGLSTDSTLSLSNRLSPATSTSQQSWNDNSLRAWLEDGSEIKDMMVMIHDKSGVVPVSDDHPLMAGLFTEQKKGVQDMMTELDGLLGSYLKRKGIAFG